jgi:hypothetical protein
VPAILAVVLAAGCSAARPAPAVDPQYPRQDTIEELRVFQESLGLARTGNFERYAASPRAVYRCYYTGRLELPASYGELRLVHSDEPRCPIDEEAYDVFFYPVEAVATGSSPVSPALAEASLERLLVVVPHEDFHDQQETRRAAPEIAEAAATLVGFLAASEFARARYGEDSARVQRLDREAGLFLEKAHRVNASYERLAAVYAAFRAGEITMDEALARKATLFGALHRECAAPAGPVSFNSCPAVMNNAGLAFDRTYTRYYPRLFELYVSLGRDAKATVAALRRVVAAGPRTEAELAAALRARGGR